MLGHFATHVVASDPIDSSQFMWFFAWWPHAILHGLNPFVTHAMFVPEGFNLTWSTAMPGPALLLSPVTELFGASVTWNVIQLASPALGAWTMYLLCRELTGRTGPSLAAGYVFGFSPYMLVHLTGGPYLALVALLPLIILLVVRRVRGTIGPRRFVILTALCLLGEFSTSSEVLATATIFGAVGYATAWLLLTEHRAALVRTALLLGAAYAITVVIISPYLYFFFFGHQYPPGAVFFPADVVSFGLPPSLVALGRHAPPFGGSNNEAYLGLPMIVLILAWVWTERRTRRTWTIVVPMVAAALCSLGGYLMVRGHFTAIPGVWKWLAHLPILKYAIPVRLSLFVILPAAIIVALFLAARSGPRGPPGPALALGAGRGGHRVHRPRRRLEQLEHGGARPGVLRQRPVPPLPPRLRQRADCAQLGAERALAGRHRALPSTSPTATRATRSHPPTRAIRPGRRCSTAISPPTTPRSCAGSCTTRA